MTTSSQQVLSYLRERLQQEQQALDQLLIQRHRIDQFTDDADRRDVVEQRIRRLTTTVAGLRSQIETLEKVIAAEE